MFLALQRHPIELRPISKPGPWPLLPHGALALACTHSLPSSRHLCLPFLLPGVTLPCSLQTSLAQGTVWGTWGSPGSSVTVALEPVWESPASFPLRSQLWGAAWSLESAEKTGELWDSPEPYRFSSPLFSPAPRPASQGRSL